MKQNRFKSAVAWATLLPVIIILGDTYGLWNIIGMSGDVFTQLFTSVSAVLVAFGVFNDPTNKEGF